MEDQRKNYFSQAYSTGADIWTLHDYREVIEPFVSRLPAGSLVLDLGSGARGGEGYRTGLCSSDY